MCWHRLNHIFSLKSCRQRTYDLPVKMQLRRPPSQISFSGSTMTQKAVTNLLIVFLFSSQRGQCPCQRRQVLADVGVRVNVDAGHLPLDVQEPLGVLLLHRLGRLAADLVRTLLKKKNICSSSPMLLSSYSMHNELDPPPALQLLQVISRVKFV